MKDVTFWNHLRTGLILLILLPAMTAVAQDTLVKDGFRRFYYPDGKVASEGMIRNGKPDGYWKSYGENGKLKSEGNRKDFELDSLWKFYDEKGKLILEISYSKGKKNGIKSTYLEKEIIRENFKNDVKDGYTRYYYPDGKLKEEIPFVNGQEQGFGKEYDSGGTIITLTEYKKGFIVDRLRINRKDKNGKKQGKWFTFYPSGGIRTEAGYRNDLLHGYYKEYQENGDLLKILKYTDGQMEVQAEEIRKPEIQNEYYPNGKVKISAMYRNGVQDGIMRQYDTAGRVEKSFLYKNGAVVGEGIILDDGERNGPWKEYYPDGSLKAEGKYEKGRQTGEWKYYYPNGKTEQTGKFSKAGKPDGVWKWYFESGQLQREENYRAGLKDGLSVTYDESGTVIEEGEYVDDKEDGPWTELTGDTYMKGSYRDGMRNGMWAYYYLVPTEKGTDSICFFRGNYIEDYPDGKHVYSYPSGKTKTEGRYLMGKREGDWYLYNEDGTLFLVITYRGGVEVRYDGVKIKPPYEYENEEN